MIANAFFNISAKYRIAVNSVINSPGGRGLAGEGEGTLQLHNSSRNEDALLSMGIFLLTFSFPSSVMHLQRILKVDADPRKKWKKFSNCRNPLQQPREDASKSLAESITAL